MKEYKRIKNVSLIWTEEFDIIKEWDDNGHIIKQEIANYQRYRTISWKITETGRQKGEKENEKIQSLFYF